MANSQSALKRVRQTATRSARNQALKSRVKSARKAAIDAIESGDKAAIDKALGSLYSAADRAVKNGAVHRNYSSRLKSLFAKRGSA